MGHGTHVARPGTSGGSRALVDLRASVVASVTAPLVEVLSAAQATEQLAESVTVLVDSGLLSAALAQPLSQTLDRLLDAIDAGKVKQAVKLLKAFLAEVDALVKAGQLDPDDGEMLTRRAEAVLSALT